MTERAGASPAIAAPGPTRRWGDLLPRILSGIVMVTVALATTWLGGPAFMLFWFLASGAVLWEWQRLIAPQGATLRLGIGAVALAVALALVKADLGLSGLAVLAAGAVAVAGVARATARPMAACGVIYAGALLMAVVVLRASVPGGADALLWLFAVVWGTDVMAYFGGRLIGGAKLWPRLSPSKTWSGFLVGVGSGAVLGLAAAPADAAHGPVLVIGLVAAVLSQGGDLLESSIKRRYGVKDTSHIIPGHGGVMDRLDGFVVAAVFAACLGVAHGGLGAAAQGLFHWP